MELGYKSDGRLADVVSCVLACRSVFAHSLACLSPRPPIVAPRLHPSVAGRATHRRCERPMSPVCSQGKSAQTAGKRSLRLCKRQLVRRQVGRKERRQKARGDNKSARASRRPRDSACATVSRRMCAASALPASECAC